MAKEDIFQSVSTILDEYLISNNLELYNVLFKKEGKDWILRVFLDKPIDSENEYVSIDECETVNRFLSEKLDELDIIDRSYKLEVSSPGLDRELIKESDFIRFAGREIEIKTYEQINGVKNFSGILLSKNDDIVAIKSDDMEIELPIEKISKINLAVIF